jgi:hypothetical protein
MHTFTIYESYFTKILGVNILIGIKLSWKKKNKNNALT